MTSQTCSQDVPGGGYTLGALHVQVGGQLTGDAACPIVGVNSLEFAQPGQLSFAEGTKYLAQATQSRASALIVPVNFPPLEGRNLVRIAQPRLAFVRVMRLFADQVDDNVGVHRDAVVAPDVVLGDEVTIRECAVIRSQVTVGRGTRIDSGAHIGERVVIGEHCRIGPNVVILRDCRVGHRVILHAGTVIGEDGFGYVWSDGRHEKIPQLGNVIIEDDVELGANVCVDRATFGSTIVKRGTKVDNLVQIAHNDLIGEHVIMAGQVGLAGSVHVGNRAILGGQAGVADHVTIGDDARLGAGAGVTRNVAAGQTVFGYPARPIEEAKRQFAALVLLPNLLKQLKRQQRPTSTPQSATVDS